MNGCQNPDDLSAFQRLNRMGPDWRVSFDKVELEKGLWRIAQAHSLSDDDLCLVASLVAAFTGTHTEVRVTVEPIPESVTPRRIGQWARDSTAKKVADFVDERVADGVKQESAIRDATSRFKVSRREAFRMLKEVRKTRLEWADWDNPYSDYEITKDGRLVPKENIG